MAPVTHQTIKLGKGNHSSPEDGACVMELALVSRSAIARSRCVR